MTLAGIGSPTIERRIGENAIPWALVRVFMNLDSCMNEVRRRAGPFVSAKVLLVDSLHEQLSLKPSV